MRRIIAGFLALACCCSVVDAAQADGSELPKIRRKSGYIGFAFGAVGYWPDTESLSRAFTAVEDYYRDQGWTIPGHGEFSPRPLLTFSVRFQAASPIGFMIEASRSAAGSDDKVDVLSATLLVDFGHIKKDMPLKPYAGVGATDVNFKFRRGYGAQISGNPGDPYYDILDYIEASGHRTGANVVGGLQLAAMEVQLNLYGGYWWLPEMSDDFGTGIETTMNLSSFIVGAQVTLKFP